MPPFPRPSLCRYLEALYSCRAARNRVLNSSRVRTMALVRVGGLLTDIEVRDVLMFRLPNSPWYMFIIIAAFGSHAHYQHNTALHETNYDRGAAGTPVCEKPDCALMPRRHWHCACGPCGQVAPSLGGNAPMVSSAPIFQMPAAETEEE
jgi:hypothetical protein